MYVPSVVFREFIFRLEAPKTRRYAHFWLESQTRNSNKEHLWSLEIACKQNVQLEIQSSFNQKLFMVQRWIVTSVSAVRNENDEQCKTRTFRCQNPMNFKCSGGNASHWISNAVIHLCNEESEIMRASSESIKLLTGQFIKIC